ncbi:hypothetical protein SprV_0902730800 [Sparganum proliferum]
MGMDLFAATSYNFDLIISADKTVAMHQPPPNAAYSAPHTNASVSQLHAVDTLTYLGSILSRSTKIDDELSLRISKAS